MARKDVQKLLRTLREYDATRESFTRIFPEAFKVLGWDPDQLAEELGVSSAAVRSWARGTTAAHPLKRGLVIKRVTELARAASLSV